MMAVSRVLYAAAFLGAVYFLIRAVAGARYDSVAHSSYSDIQYFGEFWDIAFILFAVHLVLLAYLLLVEKLTPKWINILLTITALGYLVDSLGRLYFSDYRLNCRLSLL